MHYSTPNDTMDKTQFIRHIWYHLHFSKFSRYCLNTQGSVLFSFSPFSIAPMIQHWEVSVQLSSADNFSEALSFPGWLWRRKRSLQQSHPSLSLTRILNAGTSFRQTPITDSLEYAVFTQSQALWQKSHMLLTCSSILASAGGGGRKCALGKGRKWKAQQAA